mmetsp:Transcript_5513/g.22542  ORF Transcript_5513/g.22542 Transcript_5513/m.22542 type:complete len:123 (+) Transcript_5513:843-1211(+)
MLAITLFWIVAFGVMIYFMIKEWKGLSRATRAKVSPSTAASPRSTICARDDPMSTPPRSLDRPFRSFPPQNLKLRTVIIPGRGTVQVVAKPAPPGDPEHVPPTVSQGPRRKRMVDGELELPR